MILGFMIENPSDCDCMLGAKNKENQLFIIETLLIMARISVEEQLKRLTVYFDVESSKIDDMFTKSSTN